MPREKAVRSMLENTEQFESLLSNFLGKDYDGPSPDFASYPQTGSLVDQDGAFLLFRLTGSPLYTYLKISISKISEVADKVFAATPGKEAFDWISRAVRWIDEIQSSVTKLDCPCATPGTTVTRLVIPGQDAQRLLSQGEEILLNFPDDLRHTLSTHGIYVSTNKEGKLTVKSKKGGAHHAVGVTAIRWCPVLFDSMKADVVRLKEWEKWVGEVSVSLISFKEQLAKGTAMSEETLLRHHAFFDDVSDLVDELGEMVVVPSKSLIDSAQKLLCNLAEWLAKFSSANDKRKYAMMRYRRPSEVVSERFNMLDALAQRAALEPKIPDVAIDGRQGHFRVACRVLLEGALQKGMSLMDLKLEDEACSSFCALKAWEIEQALFHLYHTGLNGQRITPEYRDQARALKRSLEDPENLILCSRVLAGELEAAKLVRMSTDELATPQMKEDRAKVEEAARQNVVLTGRATNADSLPVSGTPVDRTSAYRNAHPEQQSATNATVTIATDIRNISAAPSPILTRKIRDPNTGSSLASPRQSRTLTTPEVSGGSSFSLGSMVRNTQAIRPPPPPSLAASLIAPAGIGASSSHSDQYVCNRAGTDQFFLSIAQGSRQFVASFLCESDPGSISEGLLPEELRDKARLQIDSFSSFLHQKLESSRKWNHATLQLVVNGKKNEQEYKKFYREYESRQRIAAFELENDGKLFLVTPKFHRAAKGICFEKEKSTYAVVLVRKDPAK